MRRVRQAGRVCACVCARVRVGELERETEDVQSSEGKLNSQHFKQKVIVTRNTRVRTHTPTYLTIFVMIFH